MQTSPFSRQHIVSLLAILIFCLSSCNGKKEVKPPTFTGDYTVVTSATYSILGREGKTTPEFEHVKIRYSGGDTVIISSDKTFKKSNIRAIFQDSIFTLIPFEKDSSPTTGSGEVSKGELIVDITQSGAATAYTHLEGSKNNGKNLNDSPTLSEAKRISEEVIEGINEVEKKKISRSTLDKRAKPLQKKLDALRLKLDPTEIDELDKYRTALLGQVVE